MGTASFLFSVKDNGVGIPLEYQKRIFDSFEQLGSSVSRSEGTGLGLPISSSIVQAMGGKLELRINGFACRRHGRSRIGGGPQQPVGTKATITSTMNPGVPVDPAILA